MAEIAIITRCRNRLEYTIQTIHSVQKTEHDNWHHYIIDNDSTDGTMQWFKWMNKNTKLLKNLSYYHYDENLGDWGGMLTAQKLLSKDCEYVVQLDNDIIIPPDWLTAMQTIIKITGYPVVMLRRANVLWKLKPLSKEKNIESYLIARVERAVACFMMKREFYDLCCKKIPPAKGMRSKYIIAQLAERKIYKILNVKCNEIDSLTQRKLYNPKNPQVWEKI